MCSSEANVNGGGGLSLLVDLRAVNQKTDLDNFATLVVRLLRLLQVRLFFGNKSFQLFKIVLIQNTVYSIHLSSIQSVTMTTF